MTLDFHMPFPREGIISQNFSFQEHLRGLWYALGTAVRLFALWWATLAVCGTFSWVWILYEKDKVSGWASLAVYILTKVNTWSAVTLEPNKPLLPEVAFVTTLYATTEKEGNAAPRTNF